MKPVPEKNENAMKTGEVPAGVTEFLKMTG
jgi:hypothetical protein